jgi:DNA polymerase-4
VYIEGFFAAVEQAIRPRFRGKPVVVGRQIVISASYEATLLGITSGLSIDQARALCPDAAVVPCRYPRYAEFSKRLFSILESFPSAVDSDSHHGFYLDFFVPAAFGHDFPGTLRRMQLQILKQVGLSVSIGAARTRVAAAVASRLARQGGVRIVAPGTEAAFLAALPVEALSVINGIDPMDLRKRGIFTIAELRRVPLASLQSAYGNALARQIWRNSRALDNHPDPSRPVAIGSRKTNFDRPAGSSESPTKLLPLHSIFRLLFIHLWRRSHV